MAPPRRSYLVRMRRRAFLTSGLAGLALPAAAPAATANAPVDQAAFDAWEADFIARSSRAGVSSELLKRQFKDLTLDPRVVALDGEQPEFSRPISDYIRSVASDERVAVGRSRRAAAPWLDGIEQRYGTPPEILVSIWAVESGFGAIQGDFDVLRSLATLAAAGRRRDWAEGQILALLRIIASGEASRAQLKGSWAGAMGQTQLEPQAYLDDAVDARGGGRPDVWGSSQDALASAANLLAKSGWRRSEAWQREARLPASFDYGLSEGPPKPVAAWWALGVRPMLGDSFGERAPEAILLLPAGAAGPAFFAYPNHFIIRKYNNSIAYALGVGLLADRIAGRAGVVAPWPHELPLSIADRVGAQAALTKLGYDAGPADGQVGLKTRIALRAWQRANGQPADGYLSPHVAGQLVAQAAGR
ncbi:MAG TPA: peptidoglycan-binding protein [Caulobacteraceae bacterium]|nr:peptidoglycan-binding protein [Caulobacteraceae bacterium]